MERRRAAVVGYRHRNELGGVNLDLLHTVIMPCISAFYGIVIYMYWRDHPPPHFHTIYAEHEAEISINSLEIIDGSLPQRARRLVLEWARLHREELLANWERARADQPLRLIEPLD